jgi:murein DD-endopeptidase MepM/ murein hydrolase activator NlpD
MYRVVLLAALLAPSIAVADPTMDERVASEASVVYHGAAEAMAAIVPSPIPDITMLTTEPIPQTLSSGYGWRDDPIRHTWRFHSGTDFPADYGTPVLAAGTGKVIFAGRFSGYGNCVQIDHGNGVITLYGHMRKIEVKKAQILAAGARIGQVFEIRLDNRPVDPVAAMTIAQTWRDSPIAGRIAAYQLTPEHQKHLRAYSDRRDGHKEARPERSGHVAKPQVLW